MFHLQKIFDFENLLNYAALYNKSQEPPLFRATLVNFLSQFKQFSFSKKYF